ncbi:MAG: aryl-sulfate sulfotransferase [Lysobacterales bacterium]
MNQKILTTGLIVVLISMLAGCAPRIAQNSASRLVKQSSAVVPSSQGLTSQRYVSRKNISTDCGVTDTPPAPPPGFAVPPGGKAAPMPAAIAKRQAVGAGRPLAPTVADKVWPGITVIDANYRKPIYLIDLEKNEVGEFSGDYFGFKQLLPTGNILASSFLYSDTFRRGGGHAGCVEEYRPDGTLVWRLALVDDDYIQHHDVVKLPNGNILALVWERISAAQAIALGRNPEHVADNGDFWFDGVIEVNPHTVEIVWEWSFKNHLIQDFDPAKANYGVVADNPGKLDINAIRFGRNNSVRDDWTHANSIDYNESLDQILISSNYLWEVYVIGHGMSALEAQGDAGDFLFRWGNPANYAGIRANETEPARLYQQHDAHWIGEGLPGAGNIMIFNNGVEPEQPYTTVVELTPPLKTDNTYALGANGIYGPSKPAWEYVPKPGEEFFSWFISGAQRLPNGNTLVNHGASARLREVTAEGDIVWEYQFDDGADGPHMIFRAYRYSVDHPAVKALLGTNHK